MHCKTILALTTWGLLMLPSPLLAQAPTFTDLLARAHKQADSESHHGGGADNLTATFMSMIDLLPQATTEQLADFDALLRREEQAIAAPAGERTSTSLQKRTTTRPANTSEPAPPATRPGVQASAPGPDPVPVTDRIDRAAAPAAPPPPAVDPAPPAPSTTRSAERETPPHETSRVGASTIEPPGATASFTADMFARGQAAEGRGDISGARRYYTAAAGNGDAAAARALGRLYDPAWLRAKTIGGIDADPDASRGWYQRADALDAQQHPRQTASSR